MSSDPAPAGSAGPGEQARRSHRPTRRAVLLSAAAAGGAGAVSYTHLTPYHLAHGLLDHARHLLDQPDADAAAAATGEAGDIARRLRCQPLLDRAAAMARAPA